MEVLKELFELQDIEYKAFNDKIMKATRLPSIGVRIPMMRKLAKKYYGAQQALIKIKPQYTEEVMLLGTVIAHAPMDFEERKKLTLEWLATVDNWAAIDTCIYKPKTSEIELMYEFDKQLITSPLEFFARYGIISLFTTFSDRAEEVLNIYATVNSDKYYINMALAWGISVLLVKNYDVTVKYLETRIFTPWVHNKAIQKAIESFRITQDQKNYLRTLKVLKNN